MPGKPLVVVEHMEEYPTRWLLAEYLVAAREAWSHGADFLVTGVRDGPLQSLLDGMGIPWAWEHAWEAFDYPGTIVLDLWAERDLDPLEAASARVFVVGGIMGDHPPRGRGRLLAMGFDWASMRRLGPRQMSIHTTVWALMRVRSGVRVEDLPLVEGAEIEVEGPLGKYSVFLPFAYPAGPDGRAVVPEEVRRVLEKGVVYDEEVLLG